MRTLVTATLFLLAASGPLVAADGGLRPEHLRCEHRDDPIGLGVRIPRLSWTLAPADPAARDLKQTAYEILVASSPEALAPGKADLWDSGKVDSDRTFEVPYAGRPLVSREACWWAVRAWDQSGRVSDWSGAARWTMALLEPGEWRAEWIGLDANRPSDGSALTDEQRERIGGLPWAEAPVPVSRTSPLSVFVRRGFTLPPGRPRTRVTLVLTPDQVCAVSVNGRGVGEACRWEPAKPFDLTSAVADGDNVVGLAISQGDGYRPSVLGELEIRFADGSFVRLPIDPTWRYAATAPEGWDTPGFDGTAWAPLALVGGGRSPWGSHQDEFYFFAPAPFLKKDFSVAKPVRRATLYATALGLYEASLNGERVGRDYFTPGWTDYNHRVQYETYDVTAALRQGSNELGAVLGDGWFAGIAGYTGRRHFYGRYPRFAAQLEIQYADGSRDTLVTDGSWQGAFGSIRYADLLQGCAQDLRSSPQDWREVETGLRDAPDGPKPLPANFIVEPATADPVRVTQELPAKSVTEPQPGVFVIDFGQNMVGWVRLKAHGSPGQKVTVRHGEMLNPNGTVYTSNLRAAAATDIYWLKGEGEETLAPKFTFHGFRYAEITGLDSAPAPEEATGVVVGSPIERTGDFSCSNPLVNQLYHNIIWGQRGNYLEVPTDCPQRDERMGWTGDTQFFIPTAVYNFDADSFIERWLVTMTDDQGADGTFTRVAPATGAAPSAITAWGDAAIVCTYQLWRAYGDTGVVRRNFDALSKYIGWLQVSAQKDILTVGGYEDWLNKGGGADSDVIDTAYGATLCGMMSEMAGAVGRPDDAEKFSALRAKFVHGFQTVFLSPDGGIRNSSQTGYALAFCMDLLPEDVKAKAADRFVAEIASRDWHLATGFIGTPRLLPGLHLAGRDDVAYRLLIQDTYPSWLFQVKNGATTMWERWDGWTPDNGFQTVDMNSFNHYAFGSVGEYLYKDVAGIDSDSPGFRHILIHPRPGGGLTEARGSYDSASGRIESSWKLDAGSFVLDVVIPPNATATVTMPGGGRHDVGSGAYRFTEPVPQAPAPAPPANAARN